ncbi:MAG: HDIG domain-containing protein, partial [Desulfuromonadales bacterium]|nr:HDIG domain-containing protein [Desulfuromonadales bacterium]
MNYGITRKQALELVKQHIKSPNMLKHCLAAEAVMMVLAERVGEDPEKWGLAGLLHDLDAETHTTLDVHTRETVRILREKTVDEGIIEA